MPEAKLQFSVPLVWVLEMTVAGLMLSMVSSAASLRPLTPLVLPERVTASLAAVTVLLRSTSLMLRVPSVLREPLVSPRLRELPLALV